MITADEWAKAYARQANADFLSWNALQHDDSFPEADVLAKHVGDFRKWKEPAAYQTALKRLVRDLEAEPAAARTAK